MNRRETKAANAVKIAEALGLIREGKSVRKACEAAGIAMKVFLERVDGEQYARARDAQADAHFYEMAELEEQCKSGDLDPQAFRALLDSRKWRLARMRPKVYGDSSRLDLTSSDRSMTPTPMVDLSGFTPEQLADLARAAFRGE